MLQHPANPPLPVSSFFRQQCNVDLSADNHKECSEAIISKKLKVAGGADYDTGSNASGYKSSAGTLRAKALATYQAKVCAAAPAPSCAVPRASHG